MEIGAAKGKEEEVTSAAPWARRVREVGEAIGIEEEQEGDEDNAAEEEDGWKENRKSIQHHQ